MITVRFGAVITEPSFVTMANVGTNTSAMSRARTSCHKSRESTITNWNGAERAFPTLPTPAGTINTITTIRAVVRAVISLAELSRPPLIAVAGERSNTETVTRALMWTGRFVTVFSLVTIGAVGAIFSCEMPAALTDSRGWHTNTVCTTAVTRAVSSRTIFTIEADVALAMSVLVALTTTGTITGASLEGTVGTIRKCVTFTTARVSTLSGLRTVIRTNGLIASLSSPTEMAGTSIFSTVPVVVAIVRALQRSERITELRRELVDD